MDEIEIVAYDAAWPDLFEAEASALRAALPADAVLEIVHVGSTAVPGLAGKPIIDIMIATPDLGRARACFPGALEPLGYEFRRNNPDPERLFFVKGRPPRGSRRTHHVHVCADAAALRRHIVFSEHLRADPQTAKAYEALKRDLAARYRHDREAYTDAKSAFIVATLERIGAAG
ncbi:MAG: GrpB family protein [Alphaproteobacteria bacterium]|nr:GrpB family protein [Alphaproteobacteria bacterium]